MESILATLHCLQSIAIEFIDQPEQMNRGSQFPCLCSRMYSFTRLRPAVLDEWILRQGRASEVQLSGFPESVDDDFLGFREPKNFE